MLDLRLVKDGMHSRPEHRLLGAFAQWLFAYAFLALVPADGWIPSGRGKSAGPNVDEEIGNQHPDQGAGFLLTVPRRDEDHEP